MNKLISLKSTLMVLALSIFMVGCESDTNDDIMIDPGDQFDGELSVFENGGDSRTVTIDGSSVSGSTANVKVSFMTTTNKMKRLYVTQNVSDFGAEPYQFSVGGVMVDDKKDGSLDLTSDNENSFEFAIPFPVPTSADSKIVYTIWATTGRGDFRDISKRNAIADDAIGTITISGSGTNVSNGIKTFTQTMLAAPLGSGASETFISLYNNEVYVINDGVETAALWDFGYYYGATQNASLASTANYPSNIIDVPAISGLDAAELNNFYIATSTIDFDAVTSASDLDGITRPTTERVTSLSVDDVLEFEDQYGNKGVIKVIEISGTDGTGDFIKIDIKVQV